MEQPIKRKRGRPRLSAEEKALSTTRYNDNKKLKELTPILSGATLIAQKLTGNDNIEFLTTIYDKDHKVIKKFPHFRKLEFLALIFDQLVLMV